MRTTYRGYIIEVIQFQDKKSLFLCTIQGVPRYKNYATESKALSETKKLIDGYPEFNKTSPNQIPPQ